MPVRRLKSPGTTEGWLDASRRGLAAAGARHVPVPASNAGRVLGNGFRPRVGPRARCVRGPGQRPHGGHPRQPGPWAGRLFRGAAGDGGNPSTETFAEKLGVVSSAEGTMMNARTLRTRDGRCGEPGGGGASRAVSAGVKPPGNGASWGLARLAGRTSAAGRCPGGRPTAPAQAQHEGDGVQFRDHRRRTRPRGSPQRGSSSSGTSSPGPGSSSYVGDGQARSSSSHVLSSSGSASAVHGGGWIVMVPPGW